MDDQYKKQLINSLINNREKYIPKEDINVINICLENSCSIFGGYIRDIIAGIQPRDIDVLVPTKNFYKLIKQLTNLGYYIEDCLDDIYAPTIISCEHITLKQLDLHICDEEPNDSLNYSWLVPNIDINVLALGSGISLGKQIVLYNWSIARDPDLYENQSVLINEYSDILDNIIKRKMTIISEEDIDENKLEQYKLRGYHII